ncbi:MAG: glycosyltransferase family 2 protein [Fibrobacter sp.]|nr:glycosyltransferase family 2 protein [Fibrobacter sp.]
MFENERQIAVLLATYNGARFIREQLESLFRQTLQQFHLYIRDDGSTDDTLKIVEEFVSKYPNRITVVEDAKAHRGAAGSFMYLLQQVNSSYYMFCDQDDVWLESKIEDTFNHMLGFNQQIPVVVATDLRVVDENLKTLKESFNADLKIDVFRKHPQMLCVRHVVTGCTMMFNQLAKCASLPMSPRAMMHDEWVTLCAYFKNGVVSVLDKATICYRQHSLNTLGANSATKNAVERVFSSSGRQSFMQAFRLVHRDFGVSFPKFLLYKILYSWF